MKRLTLIVLMIAAVLLAACSNNDDKDDSLEAGNVERGAELFKVGKGDDSPPCSACHKVAEGGTGIALGPVLGGIATNGATRIDDMSAEDYIQDSILHPENYLVPGFRVSMYADYAEHLTDQDVADLVAYLMSL